MTERLEELVAVTNKLATNHEEWGTRLEGQVRTRTGTRTLAPTVR